MKITILTGSPRENGNSAYLAEQFAKGAREAGHDVFIFDCAAHILFAAPLRVTR